MDSSNKKALKDAYRNKPVLGGVCCIRCSGNGRVLLQSTANIDGLRHRFEFGMSINSCPDPALRSEWEQYGKDAFSFEVLEELKKGADQTDREFAADIATLYGMWKEKLNT